MFQCPRIMQSDTAQEKVQYDSIDFPLYIVKAHLADIYNYSAICHWHEDLEFIYIWEGYMDYNVNGTITRLHVGEGIFVNAKQLHFGYSKEYQDCIFLTCLINPLLLNINPHLEQVIRKVIDHPQWSFEHLRPDIDWQQEIISLLLSVYDCYNAHEDGFELTVESLYFQILSQLYQHRPEASENQGDEILGTRLSSLKTMIAMIETHYKEGLTLNNIADAGAVSASTCCRLFQKYLKRSPIEFLTEVRLSQSCSLLKNSSMNMTEIAHSVGFNNSSYFSERFRYLYHCTPSEYRARLTEL